MKGACEGSFPVESLNAGSSERFLSGTPRQVQIRNDARACPLLAATSRGPEVGLRPLPEIGNLNNSIQEATVTHPQDEIEQLKLRIQELERGEKQRKRTRILSLFALGAVLLCAADRVSERMVVEDRNGKVRASLHVDPGNGRAS